MLSPGARLPWPRPTLQRPPLPGSAVLPCCLAGREPPTDENYCVYADSVFQHAFALFRYAIRLTDVGEYERAERLSTASLLLFRRQDK